MYPFRGVFLNILLLLRGSCSPPQDQNPGLVVIFWGLATSWRPTVVVPENFDDSPVRMKVMSQPLAIHQWWPAHRTLLQYSRFPSENYLFLRMVRSWRRLCSSGSGIINTFYYWLSEYCWEQLFVLYLRIMCIRSLMRKNSGCRVFKIWENRV